MNLNGLWTAAFSSSTAIGSGTVTLLDGKVFGGDSNYTYLGNYTVTNQSFHADVNVSHYFGPLNNVFGSLRSVQLKIEGGVSEQLIMAQGFDPGMPTRRITIKLERVAQLT